MDRNKSLIGGILIGALLMLAVGQVAQPRPEIGRYQIVSAVLTIEALGAGKDQTKAELLRIDTSTGEMWYLEQALVRKGIVRNWWPMEAKVIQRIPE